MKRLSGMPPAAAGLVAQLVSSWPFGGEHAFRSMLNRDTQKMQWPSLCCTTRLSCLYIIRTMRARKGEGGAALPWGICQHSQLEGPILHALQVYFKCPMVSAAVMDHVTRKLCMGCMAQGNGYMDPDLIRMHKKTEKERYLEPDIPWDESRHSQP